MYTCTYILLYTYTYYVPEIMQSQYIHHNNRNNSAVMNKMIIKTMMTLIHHGKRSVNGNNFNCKILMYIHA